MNLVCFSIKTKGMHNFTRRLWTVFTRFGFSEEPIRRSLYAMVGALAPYRAAPTFFIPAVVLRRHPGLLTEIARQGAEIGVHGYVHNDYRLLSETEQYRQTSQAISAFKSAHIAYRGFRNPYLGWTEASLRVFSALGFAYESNDAVIHDVIDCDALPPLLRSGYEKSLALFQAIPCTRYTLRPHTEGALLRIPISIPDDEILVDRLRMKPQEVGRVWSAIMQRVYDLEGLCTLNLHPERGLLCKQSLDILLNFAAHQPLPVWVARLEEIAQWWKERSQFRLKMTWQGPDRWLVEATCTPGAAILARHVTVEDQPVVPWSGVESRLHAHQFIVKAPQCPCIALSPRTEQEIADFLQEQGYPVARCAGEEAQASTYALYLDLAEGLGATRQEQIQRRSALVERIEQLEAPLLRFAAWPGGSRAALAVTGDIDSVTIQDFFLRVLEVRRSA